MEPFLSQLAELCVTERTRSKWVLVPNHSVARTLGDRLVLEGTNWANLRFVTALDLALRMGAPFLVSRGIDPSTLGLGPALMIRLLVDLPEGDGYFRPLAEQPVMAKALWSAISELRMTGLSAKQLASNAFESIDKHKELQALLAAYESFLFQTKRGDVATVYEEAIKQRDWCPIQSEDCWTELPDTLWSTIQQNFLAVLPGERIAPRVHSLPGSTLPRRLTCAKIERSPPNATNSPLAFLLTPRQTFSWSGVQLFHAGGRDAEIEEVFRRILASGSGLDQAEIACCDSSLAGLIWEKACRYDWPVTIGPGIPAALTRSGRALLAFCAWIESDFTAGVLRRLLDSGDISLGSVEDVTSGQAARLLLKSDAGWGRTTYKIRLGRLIELFERLAGDEDGSTEQRVRDKENAARTERLLAWVDQLLYSVPSEDQDGQVGLSEIAESALSFVERFAVKASALDAVAQPALTNAIKELRELGSFRCQLPVALSFIRDCVDGVTVGRDRSRPGHLHISLLQNAGYANRPLLFVVGLEEGRLFPAPIENPVLLDSERRRIHPSLQLDSDRIEEAVFAVFSRLACLGSAPGAQICFSYSCSDLREYRETYPSWIMLQAYRLQVGDPTKSYRDLKAVLGMPKSNVPDSPRTALSDSDWWLNGLKMAGVAGAGAVLRHFPSLAEGRRAEEERRSSEFGEYDGFVPAAGKSLDPCAREHAVSPTELESAAGCPFRYFLSRGLSLEASDESERDADLWLHPVVRGSELHSAYASILSRCREENRKPAFETDWPLLLNLTHQRLNALREENPPPSYDVFEREVQDFIGDIELFLKAECESEPTRNPIGFEVSFGSSPHDQDKVDPLAQCDPILIDLGQGLRFRLAGQIDRIDQIGPSSFEIIDYKTGAYFEQEWRGQFAGASRLQHALYGLAAAELLKRKYSRPAVVGGTYYFSTAKGQQERVHIKSSGEDTLTVVLGDLRQVISSGTFVHALDESACTWCKFHRACGDNMPQQAANKQSDPKLAPYRRMVAHE